MTEIRDVWRTPFAENLVDDLKANFERPVVAELSQMI